MSKREDNTTQFAMPLFTLPRSFAAGRYQIQGRLGEGGQKHVLLARDLRLDREVVLSVLKPGGDPASQQRLIREARALAALGDHPNIVTVFDIGEEAGCPYLVCQYVQGGSVADLLRASPAGLPAERVLAIAIGVCHALAYAHAAGIVHRDIKPANIWLTQDGSVKLGDFGLALRLNSAEVTMSRMLVGTATYISPEQATGDPAGPASDLYSLGVVLYELLTGRPPFISDNLVGVLWQHANAQPVAPSWHNPGIPPPLESLVLQLLAKNPAERPSSAAALAETLTGIAGGTRALEPRAVPPAAPLSRMASGTFVGREAELEQVRTALHDALAGQSRLVFLVGEPGSGKTHTSGQAATYAQLRGFLVITGQCYEGEGAPPFWPWVRILQAGLRPFRGPRLRGCRAGRNPARDPPGHGAAASARASRARPGPLPPVRKRDHVPAPHRAVAAAARHPRRPPLGRCAVAATARVPRPRAALRAHPPPRHVPRSRSRPPPPAFTGSRRPGPPATRAKDCAPRAHARRCWPLHRHFHRDRASAQARRRRSRADRGQSLLRQRDREASHHGGPPALLR